MVLPGSFSSGLKTLGIVLLFSLASPTTSRANDAGSIESLLNDAEGALLGRKRPPNEPGSAAPTKRSSRATPQKKSEEAQATPPPQKLDPIDTSGIQRVIALDLEASLREREPLYPIAVLSVSGGMHWLGSTYRLTKDDDVFSATDGGRLQGAYLAFRPVWKLGWLEAKNFGTYLSPVLGAGYSQGDVRMRRSGIQTGDRVYGVKLFPVDIGVQASVEYAKTVGFLIGYGAGLEILHQAGSGVSDSVTDLFHGDQFWLGLSARITSAVEVMISWKSKGTGLLFRNSTYGGQLLSAGVSFAFSS